MALRKVTETEGKPGLMVALDSFAISRVGDALGVVHHVGVGETLRADSWIVLQAPSLFKRAP